MGRGIRNRSRGQDPPDGRSYFGGTLGMQSAETVDCLAALLGSSNRRGRERAHAILARFDLLDLAHAGALELSAELDVGLRAAERLAAAFALARRVPRAGRPARPSMRSARRVYELLRPRLVGLEQETFLALLLDGKHRLREVASISVGTLTTSLVHPREVFRPALRAAAAAIVVAHNHPSGDPEPSAEDLDVTRRLIEVGELTGIPLIDHVVVAERGFVSLRERLPFGRVAGTRSWASQSRRGHGHRSQGGGLYAQDVRPEPNG